MAERLVVTLNEVEAGHLMRGGRRSAVFVPAAGSPVLSTAVEPWRPWTPELTRAWFEGLLPEGETRVRAAGRFAVQPDDWFALLAEIGWECAGAVSVRPEDRPRQAPGYAPIDDGEVGARLDALPGRPFDVEGALRMSLGGAQDKLVLAWRDEGWALPLGGSPSTHILKPEPAQWPGVVAAEAWGLALAGAVTEAAVARPSFDLGRRPVLVVTRYDRVVAASGSIRRLHQEDLCQALGLIPGAKYHEPPFRPQKPSLARLAEILRTRGVAPATELEALVRRLVVTIALGNADAHAKNWSLLHEGNGLVRLAPMYDVVPTAAFVPGQRFASLPVDGRFRLDEIGVEQILTEAGSWGVPTRLARRIVTDTLGGLASAATTVTVAGLTRQVRDAVSSGISRLLRDRPGS